MQTTSTHPRYEAVIFDLDGTLADTFPTVLRIFNQVMHNRTGRAWTFEELLPYFGPPENVIFQRLFPAAEDHQPIIEEYYRLSRADGDQIKPFAGIHELVAKLRQSGVKLGVYSGASTEAARIRVGHAGLLDYFDDVIGGDQVAQYKPHPEGLQKLMQRFGVTPEQTVYVGDMTVDIQAGRDAGTATVAVTWGAGTRAALAAVEPDFLLDDPLHLHHLINPISQPKQGATVSYVTEP